MAVNQTGAIYKAMTIDGESSRTYGVYITGSAVYNAPEREVEMVSVPGRNGQLAIDKGRFENIEVTYPAGIYADTEEDFAEAVSNFRNFLCSRSGYVRIEDDYNPDEYRMGIYKSGLEVETAGHKAGEFEIIFDCKPQRWLTDGETAVTVDSGDVIGNPTLFESSPLLEVEGYGTVGFNGYEIEIEDVTYGDIEIYPSKAASISQSRSVEFSFSASVANTGDHIYCDEITLAPNGFIQGTITETVTGSDFNYDYNIVLMRMRNLMFTVGTAELKEYKIVTSGSNSNTYIIHVEYDGSETITLSFTCSASSGAVSNKAFDLYSTKRITSGLLYIDCDLGEAYKYESDVPTSLNKYIDLGSDLPKLQAGANSFSFDNTITSLKVMPRWWKV